MLATLRTPLKGLHLLLAALAALLAVTIYCLAYTELSGRSESPIEATLWTIVNVLPWLAAFEAGKRSPQIGAKALALSGALGVSLGLGILVGEGRDLGFELVRRLPGLLITACLLAAVARPAKARTTTAHGELNELPLAPGQIDWVAAAGNYVELHGCGRTLVHRVPLSSLEAQLSSHGFVRVHRSTLVRRDRIKRVRPLDIVLHDGTSLKTGKRYRASFQAVNLVPSSHGTGGSGEG